MRKPVRCSLLAGIAAALLLLPGNARADPPPAGAPAQLILALYMPWYEAPPASPAWGWHWTMDAFDPERIVDGRRQIASHFYPLVGPHDSGDPHLLEYHLLLMKLSGIDGVVVDWYGRQQFRDYGLLHRNTGRLIDRAKQLGLKVAICYEDQTLPALVEASRLKAQDRVTHAASEIEWLARHWFPLDNYVRVDDRPLLLSFGQTGLTDEEWTACLASLKSPVAYFSEHHRRTAAIGAFDWPIPGEGIDASKQFNARSRDRPHAIPVAFPRFVDIYAEAKVHKSWGRIDDNGGATFRTTLQQALETNARQILIATWNDWGEGTMIEPSREFGYRDLEVVQAMRRQHVEAGFSATPPDLRLPRQLLQRRRATTEPNETKQLDQIAALLASGQLAEARARLEALERP